jgi:histidine triad (HIT) family protein
MPGIFSKIIAGEIPCHKIAESERFFSFLDIRPLTHGHTLVIPKIETDEFFTLNEDELSGILLFAKPIATAIKLAFPCKRVGMAVIGLEVPHAHMHLIPLQTMRDINFESPKLEPSHEDLEMARRRILSFLPH